MTDPRGEAPSEGLSLRDELYYEIEGVLQDTKDGAPMDKVCRETLLRVQSRLDSALSATQRSEPDAAALRYLLDSTAPDGQWADQAVHNFVGAMLKQSPPPATARSEAMKLAEQWKGRADDAGRLSRAVLSELPQSEKPARQASFEAWLCREMPEGTVIGDPKWWAPRIARAFARSETAPSGTAKDTARLDYLEREGKIEEKRLRTLTRGDYQLAIFRRNVPITRAAIDEEMRQSGNEEKGK
jgi:hypothetical protein